MIVLGIDPGTHRLGYGVIRADGAKLTSLTYGCLEPQGSLSVGDRLLALRAGLQQILAEFKPDTVGVEDLYFAKNVTTALRVAEARGVILLTIREALLPIGEYKPNLIKSAVTGYGLATKPQMQKIVQMLLKLPAIPKPDDAADGLAVAICHAAYVKHSLVN